MFQCKKCNRTFKSEKYLAMHKNRKTPCDAVIQCDKCNKIFSKASDLKRHKKRKTPCAPDKIPVVSEGNPTNTCMYCGRDYSTKSNLNRHLLTCDKQNNMHIIMKMLVEERERNQQQQQEISTLRSQLTTPGANITFNDNRQLHINLVNFPIKDMSGIDMKEILKITSNQPANQIIPEIVAHLHGNPDFPEHQNIYMTETDSNVTIVFGGEGEQTWHSMPKVEAIDKLKTEAMGLLTHNNKPMANYKLMDTAYNIGHKGIAYQEKIAELAMCDITEEEAIARKLVGFGETFHKSDQLE